MFVHGVRAQVSLSELVAGMHGYSPIAFSYRITVST